MASPIEQLMKLKGRMAGKKAPLAPAPGEPEAPPEAPMAPAKKGAKMPKKEC